MKYLLTFLFLTALAVMTYGKAALVWCLYVGGGLLGIVVALAVWGLFSYFKK